MSASIALALLTFVCFRLGLNLATTACLYLIIIVLLSLLGSFLSSAIVSLIAVGCLAYYFALPIFSFRVSDPLDVVAIVAFCVTSAVITTLVSRLRSSAEEALSEIEDRTRAEDALKRSEAYLAHAQQLTKAGSWAYKRVDICEYWSAEMFRIFGLDPLKECPSGDLFLSLVHPEDRQRVEEAFTQHLMQGRIFDLKYRIVRPDGQLRVIRDFGTAIFEDGVVTRSVGASLDVTEQENLTQELRRREVYLAEAQRLSQTGSFGWRVSTGEKLWSEETFRIFQYDRTTKPTVELVLQRVHPEDAARVKQTLERASRDGKDFDHQYRLVMPDRSVKHVHVVAHAERDESGELELVGAVMDVTAAKRAEEALRQSEQQWRDVFENNPTMYFMVDAGGSVIAVNPFGAEQLGYDVGELVGQPVLSVIYEHDREAAQRNVALCLKQLGRSMSWELRKVRKDGSVIWVRETGRAVLRVNEPVVLIGCEDITERKHAEERIREQEVELRQILDLTPQHVAVLGPDRSNIYVNKEALDYHGLTLEEWRSSNRHTLEEWRSSFPHRFFHPDDWERMTSETQSKFLSGPRTRWFLFRYNPMRDEQGRVTRWYVAATDIEDRKRAEAALGEQASLLNLTHDSIFVRDMDFVITYWNRGAEELYGWTAEQAVGKVSHQLLRTVFPAPIEEIRAELLRTGRWEGELVRTKAHGTKVVVASRWSLQRDERQQPLAILETNNDVTERKRADEERERLLVRERAAFADAVAAQQRFVDLVNSIDGILWEADAPSFRILFVSNQAERVLGYPVERWLSEPTFWKDHLEPEDREWAVQFIEKAIADKRDHDFEYRMIAADGSVVWLRNLASVVVEGDRATRVRGVTIDFTKRKRAEEALHQAQADLEHINRAAIMGELTASLAHEVNQPIAATVTNANTCLRWLAADTPNLEEARAAAMRIVKDGMRAGDIISRIRLLFKKGTPARELVDVNEVIREMIVLLRSEAMRYSIGIRTALAEDLPQVLGDRVQLQQVLMNLIMNSVDAMKDVDGTRDLVIKSQRTENEHLLVSVSDTGVGLPPHQADQIFNAFFTTKPHGTGMGLRISRSIIESHGGRLWAADNSLRGASFYLTLPSKAEVQE